VESSWGGWNSEAGSGTQPRKGNAHADHNGKKPGGSGHPLSGEVLPNCVYGLRSQVGYALAGPRQQCVDSSTRIFRLQATCKGGCGKWRVGLDGGLQGQALLDVCCEQPTETAASSANAASWPRIALPEPPPT
jgi:hypothetical protein